MSKGTVLALHDNKDNKKVGVETGEAASTRSGTLQFGGRMQVLPSNIAEPVRRSGSQPASRSAIHRRPKQLESRCLLDD